MQRLDPQRSLLLVIDVQERLAAAMPEAQLTQVMRAGTLLLEAARELGVSALATEQYPQGLGRTLAPLAERLAALGVTPHEKLTFSACDEPGFAAALGARGARSIVVVGMEAHVCVFQTVRELAARGLDVHVPIDGVASRRDDHRAQGLELCRSAGATLTTTETVVFDWLGRAGTDAFKRLSKLIR